jgi:hypothetical protein
VICILLAALAVFILLGYRREWQWTGFPPKKLFDWMQILVIPVAVAIGTFVLNRTATRRDAKAQEAQKEREEALETRHAEEASLQAYLDYMSRLLTDPDRPLRRSQLGDNLSVVARAQTLTALGRLEDGERKAVVLRFLYEAGLIARKRPIILLRGANLRGANLKYAYLKDVYLSGGIDLKDANLDSAKLIGAVLKYAYLGRAVLKYAHLREADLGGANLGEADLQEADLRKADLNLAVLSGAILRRANLTGANLTGAKVTKKQLDTARSLKGATMPDGSIHD